MNGNPLLNALPTTINEDKIPDGHGFQSDYKVETGAGNIQRIDNVLDYTAAEFEVDGSQFGNPNGNVQSIYFGTVSPSLNSDSSEASVQNNAEGKLEQLFGHCFSKDAGAEKCKDDPKGEINAIREDDPFLQSVKYLEKHQILRLFQNFAAQIVYKRPDNPFQFLIEELEKSEEEKASDCGSEECS